jgi:hypothetical protein
MIIIMVMITIIIIMIIIMIIIILIIILIMTMIVGMVIIILTHYACSDGENYVVCMYMCVYVCICMLGRRTSAVRERVGCWAGSIAVGHRRRSTRRPTRRIRPGWRRKTRPKKRTRFERSQQLVGRGAGVHGIWGDKRGTGNGRRARVQGVRDHRGGLSESRRADDRA